jgi:hypothetical protein
MPMFNKNMENGYNKFRKNIPKNNYFRKAHNTLNQINDFALPAMAIGSVVNPIAAPIFGSIATVLKGTQQITNMLQKTKI